MSEQITSKPAKDYRPKILSFDTNLDGLSIAAKKDILLPCNAFSISIPKDATNNLNIFEETILKLKEIKTTNTEELAELTCIKIELIEFIQNRLFQKGFLSENYEISESGKKLLQTLRYKSEAEIEYQAATVFVDLLTGNVLPYISTQQPAYKKIQKINKNRFIDFLINPTNTDHKIIAERIYPPKDAFWGKIPTANEVLMASKEFEKKFKQYSLLKKDVFHEPPNIEMDNLISINEDPELIYLHCKIIIQTGNSDDILVTNGFGFGFSNSFGNYLTANKTELITKLKEKAVIQTEDSKDSSTKTRRYNFKYPNISNRIVKIQTKLKEIEKQNIDTTNAQKITEINVEDFLKNLYIALEWTLRQVVNDNPERKWQEIFANNDHKENGEIFTDFAKKIGFVVNEKNQNLLQVKSGAIKQMMNKGNAELQPLLALAFSGAVNDANHPINNLAAKYPEFITHLLELKRYRDPIEHGNSEKIKNQNIDLKNLYEITFSAISLLIPNIIEDLKQFDDGNFLNKDIDNARLKADIEVRKMLSNINFNNLPKDVKKQLLRSELMLEDFKNDKTIEIIKCYASVMQQILFEKIQYLNNTNSEHKTKEIALDKIIQARFYNSTKDIPEQIITVNYEKIMPTLQGTSSSLGANLLVFFLTQSEQSLAKLQKLEPNFVDFIAELLELRKHGNKNIEISQKNIKDLKTQIYKTIKNMETIYE